MLLVVRRLFVGRLCYWLLNVDCRCSLRSLFSLVGAQLWTCRHVVLCKRLFNQYLENIFSTCMRKGRKHKTYWDWGTFRLQSPLRKRKLKEAETIFLNLKGAQESKARPPAYVAWRAGTTLPFRGVTIRCRLS